MQITDPGICQGISSFAKFVSFKHIYIYNVLLEPKNIFIWFYNKDLIPVYKAN